MPSGSTQAGGLEPALGEDLAALLDLGAFEPHNQRNGQTELLGGRNHALGDRVATHDTTEDVHEDAPHRLRLKDDPESLGDGLLAGASADVEEVRRLSAVMLDRIHRGHGQACAIDQTTDIPVELDE